MLYTKEFPIEIPEMDFIDKEAINSYKNFKLEMEKERIF